MSKEIENAAKAAVSIGVAGAGVSTGTGGASAGVASAWTAISAWGSSVGASISSAAAPAVAFLATPPGMALLVAVVVGGVVVTLVSTSNGETEDSKKSSATQADSPSAIQTNSSGNKSQKGAVNGQVKPVAKNNSILSPTIVLEGQSCAQASMFLYFLMIYVLFAAYLYFLYENQDSFRPPIV